MAGYTRQSTFSDGDVIQAADSNDEFNQLLAAFVNTTGHKHNGTAAEGPVIGLIGDPGVAAPLNKVVVDDGNNQIEFSIDVSSTSTEQFVVKDGVIEPTTDDDIDLGSSSKKFKDLYIDGTANVDVLNINGTALTATGAELNLLDGGTSVGTTAVAGGDGIVTNDAGTMRHTSVDTFDTYLSATTKTLTNKTLTSAVLNGTISGTSIKDEDDMSSDSASHLATQQSIKAYVDAQITAEDLDFQADSGGALNIDLDSETLTFTGGTGIDTSGSGNAVTFAIDSTVSTLAGSQTLTNKTLTTPIIAEIDNASDITLDAGGDIILDAGGANVIFKDDGTSILDIANNSSDVELTVSTADKNFAIKGTDGSSAITALDIDMALAGKATFSGDVVVTGDLTVTGDDIVMGTNTSGHIMVADGTNFNPVAVSGDVTIASSGAITIANDAVEKAMVNSNVISGQTAESSMDTTNDFVLVFDDSASALRKVTVGNLVSGAGGGLSNVVEDSSPQLGGNLDTNSQNILIDDAHFIADENGNEQIIFQTTSSAVNQIDVTNAATSNSPEISATGDDTNISLKLTPKGSGQVLIDGNVGIETGVIDLKNGGAVSNIKFYCESSNAHYTAIQSAAHSAYSGNVTITLPVSSGTVALTSDVPSSGISSGNVATFTSGVADNDFLRIDGTTVEGRSASEVLSDIGAQASLTFGISNTNAVKIDSSSVADDEYARFTANGLESRSNSEVLSDIGAVSEANASATSTALAIALG